MGKKKDVFVWIEHDNGIDYVYSKKGHCILGIPFISFTGKHIGQQGQVKKFKLVEVKE